MKFGVNRRADEEKKNGTIKISFIRKTKWHDFSSMCERREMGAHEEYNCINWKRNTLKSVIAIVGRMQLTPSIDLPISNLNSRHSP